MRHLRVMQQNDDSTFLLTTKKLIDLPTDRTGYRLIEQQSTLTMR